MRNALRSEVRKLLSVRTTYALAGLAVAVALVTAVDGGERGAAELGRPLWEQQSWLFTSLLTRLLFVVVGIRLVTEEHRYGTLTPSLLATGSRTRLLGAKVVAAAGASVALAALAVTSLVTASTLLRSQHGVGLGLTGDDVLAMVGLLVAAALYGALGVGLGAVVRQPVPATVGAVLWLALGEEVLRTRLGDAVSWLPGHAGVGLAVLPGVADGRQALVALVLLGWSALAVGTGAVLLARRDVA